MTNFTGEKNCKEQTSGGAPPSVDIDGWYILTCNELAIPNVDGKDSIMPAYIHRTDYEYQPLSDNCFQNQGIRPDYDFILREFGGYNPKEDFQEYSNIAFVNGALDEWLPGCVQETVKEDLPTFLIKNGAHHSESFLPKPDDDKLGTNLIEVRASIESYLEKWMAKYRDENKSLKGSMQQLHAQT